MEQRSGDSTAVVFLTSSLTLLIKVIGCTAGMAMWLTVGFAVWITKLVRVSVAYSIKTMQQAFTDQNMAPLERSIQVAIDFWPQGFRRILRIFDPPSLEQVEIRVTWSNLIPGLIQDLLYAAIIVATSLVVYWATTSGPTRLSSLVSSLIAEADEAVRRTAKESKAAGVSSKVGGSATGEAPSVRPVPEPVVQQPAAVNASNRKWIELIRTRGIQPGTAIGGVSLGQAYGAVVAALGVPTTSTSLRGGAAADSGRLLTYSNQPIRLEILLGPKGTVESVQLTDTSLGIALAMPSYRNVSFGNSEPWIVRNLGTPVAQYATRSPDCAAAVNDDGARLLLYAGIQFKLCTGKNSVVAIQVAA